MRLVLLSLAIAGLIAGEKPRSCEQVVDSGLHRVNWFYRPVVRQNALEIIDMLNTGRLTEGSARLYVAGKLRRFSKNEKWVLGVSREFIAKVQEARKTEACKNYSAPRQSDFFAKSPD